MKKAVQNIDSSLFLITILVTVSIILTGFWQAGVHAQHCGFQHWARSPNFSAGLRHSQMGWLSQTGIVRHVIRIRNQVPFASEHSHTHRYHLSVLPTTAMQLQACRTSRTAHYHTRGAKKKALMEEMRKINLQTRKH